MKIKPSNLENLIKEEIKIFFENHGTFPVAEDEALPGTLADEAEVNEIMKSDLKLMYMRLLQHLGTEKLLEELVKNLNSRALREVLDTLAKLYDIRIQQ